MKITVCESPISWRVRLVNLAFSTVVLWALPSLGLADDLHVAPIGAWDYFKMVFILLGFLILMYGVYYVLRRMGGVQSGGCYIKTWDRGMLSTHASVVLCQVGSHYYVLATSPKAVTLIDRLDEAPAQIAATGLTANLSFKQILSQIKPGNHES